MPQTRTKDNKTAPQRIYDNCEAVVNNPKRQQRMGEMKKEGDFYFNAQWTDKEAADMVTTGQTDVVLNTMRRAVRTLLSQMVASMPTGKFMPADMSMLAFSDSAARDQIIKTTEELSLLYDHCWYISGGSVIVRRAVQHQLITGLGYLTARLDPTRDYYRGEVVFEAPMPWEVVVPLNTSNMDFSDAEVMWLRKVVSLKKALDIVGHDKRDRIISSAYNVAEKDYDVAMRAPDQTSVYNRGVTDADLDDPEFNNLGIDWIEQELTVRQPSFLYKIAMPNGMLDTLIYEPQSGDDDGMATVQALYPNSKITQQEIKVDRIERTITCGRDYEVSRDILPTAIKSMVPVIDEDTYSPLTYGEAFFVKDAQRLLNKVFSLGILHLQTSGSGDKLTVLDGVVGATPQEVADFERHRSQPSSVSVLKYEPGEGVNISNLMHMTPATPLQPAVVQTLQLLTGWIDRLTGISPIAWGDTSGAPRTLGATMSIKEWGDENSRIPLIHLNYALRRLGDLWLDLALRHYKFPKLVTVPDSNGQLRQTVFNMPTGDGFIVNSLEDIRAKIFITGGNSLMVNRYSMLMMFQQLMQYHPVFMKMFLLYSDIPEKFELMKEIDHTAQLEQQLATLAPQFEQLQKLAVSKDEEVKSLLQQIDLTKFSSTLKQIETKYRESLKTDAARQSADLMVGLARAAGASSSASVE